MKAYLLILLNTVLVNNFVLVQFLGLCPFMGVSRKPETAASMGLATTLVLTLAAGLSYLIEAWLLRPYGLDYLRTIVFIVVIAAVVQLTEILIRMVSPLLYRVLGLFIPLITTNCAVLGVALLNARASHGLTESLVYGFGASIGFTLVLVLFAGVRERLETAEVPVPFKGTAIGLITAGIASLAFMGFSGWGRF
jgi:electron transport complex protein RnfA